jgi:hypothetical protein
MDQAGPLILFYYLGGILFQHGVGALYDRTLTQGAIISRGLNTNTTSRRTLDLLNDTLVGKHKETGNIFWT